MQELTGIEPEIRFDLVDEIELDVSYALLLLHTRGLLARGIKGNEFRRRKIIKQLDVAVADVCIPILNAAARHDNEAMRIKAIIFDRPPYQWNPIEQLKADLGQPRTEDYWFIALSDFGESIVGPPREVIYFGVKSAVESPWGFTNRGNSLRSTPSKTAPLVRVRT